MTPARFTVLLLLLGCFVSLFVYIFVLLHAVGFDVRHVVQVAYVADKPASLLAGWVH